MVIKPSGIVNYSLNAFDLYGYEETGLSRALAYILSKDKDFLFTFLKYIGVNINKSDKSFKNIEITKEYTRNEGRTDIEIVLDKNFHVIVECKVGGNKITKQREQYLPSFNNNCKKYLCFITQVSDYKKQFLKNITVKNIDWLDIMNLLNKKYFENNELINNFNKYLTRGYHMRDQKEILIQDLGNETEIKRFKEYQVYRRDITYGGPLYFSPYFTRKSGEIEGITSISRILGIITARSSDINGFIDDLKEFASETENPSELIEKWKKGVKEKVNDEKERTYYFLDESIPLPKTLLKDNENSKGWISRYINKNRCVGFDEFIRRMTIEI